MWALTGDREAALRTIDAIAAHNRDPEALFYMVRNYARIGEREKALDLLEQVPRSFFPIFTFEHDPWLDDLRQSPRFAQIIKAARERNRQAQQVYNDALTS